MCYFPLFFTKKSGKNLKRAIFQNDTIKHFYYLNETFRKIKKSLLRFLK